jgi:peptide/nickel transport system substrate-binding protein
VTHRVAWQAALATLGIVLIFIILSQSVPDLTTVEVPVAGGTYVEGVLGYTDRINPILAPPMIQANPVEKDLSSLVFDGLTTLDQTGQISPCLAIDWEVSEDGSVYDFHLRPGVHWHDGAPFTAADVAFTVQALQDPGYQGPPALSELWRNVTVEQLDETSVRFTLQEPFPSFLYYTNIGILPAHLLSNVPAAELPTHDFSTQHPVGTGMFQVESIAADRVILAANPDYWGAKPFLNRFETWFFGNWDDLLLSYDRGEIQGFHPPSPDNLADLAKLPNLQIYSAQSTGLGIIYLNLKSESLPFLQQTEVRQALLYALDRQSLIDQALDGQGVIAHSPISSILWAHDPSVRQYGYDPERAIGLLDASGWMDSDGDRVRDKEGVALSLTLLTSDDPSQTQLGQLVVNQWRAIGVDAKLQSVDGTALTELIRNRDFDAALTDIGLTADPDPYPLWHSTQVESGQNFAGFQNEEADVVMEEARFSADPEQRAELYRSFQQIFAEAVPSLPIYYPVYSYAVDTKIREVQISPLLRTSDRFRNIADWYAQTEEIVINDEEQLDKSGE